MRPRVSRGRVPGDRRAEQQRDRERLERERRPDAEKNAFYSGAEVSSGVGSDGSDGWRRETESRATTRESNNEGGGANLGDETYPPHTGRSHVTASATAKYANDTCAATRAAPSVDMVSARAPVRGPRL